MLFDLAARLCDIMLKCIISQMLLHISRSAGLQEESQQAKMISHWSNFGDASAPLWRHAYQKREDKSSLKLATHHLANSRNLLLNVTRGITVEEARVWPHVESAPFPRLRDLKTKYKINTFGYTKNDVHIMNYCPFLVYNKTQVSGTVVISKRFILPQK